MRIDLFSEWGGQNLETWTKPSSGETPDSVVRSRLANLSQLGRERN
jgi:hypothetical protein